VVPIQDPGHSQGDWINAMIVDHRIAKHKAKALLLYPPLDSDCTCCTKVHDPFHRRFSEINCAVLSHDGPKEGFVPCMYLYCLNLPTHAANGRGSTAFIRSGSGWSHSSPKRRPEWATWEQLMTPSTRPTWGSS
jgi:hypothetical protein